MPTPVGLQQLLLLLLRVGAAQANTFAPPVQLHNCSAGAATQRWHQAANGSSYILDAGGHVGYCRSEQEDPRLPPLPRRPPAQFSV